MKSVWHCWCHFTLYYRNQLGVGLMTLGVRRAGFPFCLEVTQSTAVKPAAVDEPDQHSHVTQNRHSKKNNTWMPQQLLLGEEKHNDPLSWETSLLQFQSLFPAFRTEAAGIANSRDLSNHLYYTCLLRVRPKVTSHHGNTCLWMEWSYHFI